MTLVWESIIFTAGALAGLAGGSWLFRRRGSAIVLPSGVTLQDQGATDAHEASTGAQTMEDALRAAASARARAEAANEAKSRFLASVSHEVRTPLNGILGLSDLLAATPLTAEQSSYLAAIRASGVALASLIDEILDFSKIEAGKLDLECQTFDLGALAEGVTELLAPRAQGKDLEIACHIAADIPALVVGDPNRLRQVLINLLGNAVKFTERGGVGLQVTDAPDGVRFVVTDTGPGVPDHRREAIFDDFEQADGSAARRHEGTGLGLAISRRIVKLMGGHLILEKTSERGSVFSFTIPLPAKSAATSISYLKNKQALVLSAAPFGGTFLTQMLAEAGASAASAETASAAPEGFRSEAGSFDYVLIDAALGAEEARRSAAAARNAGAHKIFILVSPFERRAFGDAVLSDFDGWLTKPIRRLSLQRRLEGVTDRITTVPVAEAQVPAPQPLKGLSVLLAEDNDINALLAEKQLIRLGASLARARNGREAVALACAEGAAYDAILMDIRMPDLDGLAATRQIRAAERDSGRKPIRIIALTANAFAEDREAAFAAGLNAFVIKPLELNQLVEAILAPETSICAVAAPS